MKVALIALVLLLGGELRAETMSFVNSTNVAIRDGNSASLYHPSITGSGMVGSISRVAVTLKNFLTRTGRTRTFCSSPPKERSSCSLPMWEGGCWRKGKT